MAVDGTDSDSLRQRVEVERIDMLYHHTRTTLATNVLLASALVAVLWPLFAHALLLGWWAAIVALVLVRLLLVRGYRRRAPDQVRRWARYLTGATLLSGLAWGLSGVLFFAPQSVLGLSFVAIVLAGIAAGSVPAYASWPPAQYSAIPTALPIAGRFLVEGGEWAVMGLICVLYLYNVQSSARQLANVIEESIRLRLEKQALAQRLGDEKQVVEAAHQAKTQFLAAASHDLRQPLHALNLMVAQWRRDPDAAERRRLGLRVEQAIAAINALFDGLLDVSKLDAGVIRPQVEAFPVQRLLDRMDVAHAAAARDKGLELRIRPCDAWVASDPVLLERILGNLVANAVRYTRSGAMLLGCRRTRAGLRIAVWDTGIGIAPDKQERIFDEFYRLDAEGGAADGGLGLGLSIVARLAGLLGHQVSVRSVPGRGSCFAVTVPETASQPHLPTAANDSAIDALQGRRVLVIDNNAQVLASTARLLEGWGCCVLAAHGAPDHVHGPVDLLLVDMRLDHGDDGVAAISRLRRQWGRDVPALILTGDTAIGTRERIAASGLPMLEKPVSALRLRSALTRLLQRG